MQARTTYVVPASCGYARANHRLNMVRWMLSDRILGDYPSRPKLLSLSES
jgi:hypothetical protein